MSQPLRPWIDGESVASIDGGLDEYLETKTVVVSL